MQSGIDTPMQRTYAVGDDRSPTESKPARHAGKGGGVAISAQHHQADGPTSLLGPVSMGKEQRAVCRGGLVVGVEAAVLLGVGFESEQG